ncbi:MAG: Gfo/Idh/MocA family oxidoreductase [Alphaproteobacteria bacterium]|nr:Gfo/Idh/MocA family oxidoreductase [Alphaproteobacteria bacterium]
MPIKFAAVGIDHRHIYDQIVHMRAVGGAFAGWWTEGTPGTLDGFLKRFPEAERVVDRRRIMEDPSIDLILIAAVNADRAALAIEAMEHGKDVMVDKPGCTTLDQLASIREMADRTGRIWSVNFSERFQVPAVSKAAELVAQGAIGRVVQTLGLGPHRLNKATRPDWFFQRARYGGVLCDIASHQIDQFLTFTGAEAAEIAMARAENFANPETPELEDFGEISLRAPDASGYIRVDWHTPDALPTWGDGRLFLLGTEGAIELRKYCELGQSGRSDNLYLVNGARCEYIDARDATLPYFENLARDIQDGTETAMSRTHPFAVTELALRAQALADKTRRDAGPS